MNDFYTINFISKDETITYDKECILNDFDGVSLYPSAMVRMPGFLRGKPKVLTNLTYDFLKRQSGYFVEIKNVKLNKFLHFPLQSEKINGIRNYTNEIKGSLYIDKVSLEDLIEFQGATFDIVRGYYFNEGHNTKIGSVIKFCFEERLKQKSKGNPIEQVYKLLMNSSYGKLIQKPIVTDLKFTNSEEKHKKYLSYNHNFIKEFTKICENKYVYKVQKSVNNHFNMCHIGSEILSWSKRIMNEVMCLAEDLDIHIFYQDTDSMHILDSQIKTLADAFYNKYGCKLIGKQLGQFHTDFSVIDSRDENGKKEIKNITAIESYFLGKKCYIDKLTCENKEEEQYMKTKYHIRMKGIPVTSIDKPLETYKTLFEGKAITFNLLKGKPKFKKDKDFSIISLTKFERKIQF